MFYKDKNTKDGFHPMCKDCDSIVGKAYRIRNKEKIREKSKNYRIKNKEKIREMKKKILLRRWRKRKVKTMGRKKQR